MDKKTEKEVMESLSNRETRKNLFRDFSPVCETKDHPDARKHQIVSFIKSGIRIIGYMIIPIDLVVAAVILVASEIIGVLEELV